MMRGIDQLRLRDLQRLAVAIGCASSGSKTSVRDSIGKAVLNSRSHTEVVNEQSLSHPRANDPDISVISIDMGIQNLAYAHIHAQQGSDDEIYSPTAGSNSTRPLLKSWNRLTVFPQDKSCKSSKTSDEKTAYNAEVYAKAAHRFITTILDKHDPTHILIEQQRFRSGGHAAVQEWTIRVGVFEGMLHAILRTLREEKKASLRLQEVVSVSPARTARFWLAGEGNDPNTTKSSKVSGREGKQAKIDIVGSSLGSEHPPFELDTGQAREMGAMYLDRWQRTSKLAKARLVEVGTGAGRAAGDRHAPSASAGETTTPGLGPMAKLDDLADSLLQGLAWLQWRKMRRLISADLMSNDPPSSISKRLSTLLLPENTTAEYVS